MGFEDFTEDLREQAWHASCFGTVWLRLSLWRYVALQPSGVGVAVFLLAASHLPWQFPPLAFTSVRMKS